MERGSIILTIVIGLVVILGVITGAFYLGKSTVPKTTTYTYPSPTPDETIAWNTYKDPTLGISFKYPSEFKLTQHKGLVFPWTYEVGDKESSRSAIVLNNFPQSPPVGFTGERVINVMVAVREPMQKNDDFYGFDSTKEIVDYLIERPTGSMLAHDKWLVVKIDNISVGGLEGVRYKIYDVLTGGKTDRLLTQPTDQIGIALNKNNKTINISIIDKSEGMPYSYKTEKVLNTFKFTDQNQVVDTADWKTYTDIMNGYSVKYPNGWILTKSETSVNFTPPGADLFPATQKNTPGALESPPSISIDVLNKPVNEADSETRSATEQSTITVSGVSGNYYTVLGAPFSIINFDLPAHDNKKTIRFTFPVNAENFSTFNTAHEQNIAKFDKETFKTIIQTFKFTQ